MVRKNQNAKKIIKITWNSNTLLLHVHSSDRKNKLIDHSKRLRELWFWGYGKCQPDEDAFHRVFNWKTTFHSLGAFMLMFHVYQKARASAHVNCHWYSALCFIVLNALLVLTQDGGHSARLLWQSSPVYYHHLWNSKQLPESSIHLHIFPIPCRLHHSSPPSVTAFVPPAAPAAKGWRVECRAAGKGWCVKPCCWRQRLCDSTSMKAVMDVGLEAGPD